MKLEEMTYTALSFEMKCKIEALKLIPLQEVVKGSDYSRKLMDEMKAINSEMKKRCDNLGTTYRS